MYRPACRIIHAGARSTFSFLAARTMSGSFALALALASHARIFRIFRSARDAAPRVASFRDLERSARASRAVRVANMSRPSVVCESLKTTPEPKPSRA
jgi:hypothetical protein